MDLLFLIPASLVLGLAVGILSGLLGIGGGTIMVPAFRLVYNMSAIAATATSMLTIVPTSVAGMVTHIRNKTCVLKVGLAAGLGGACSSWIGVILAEWSPGWCVMAAAAAVIVYSSSTMLKKALAMKPAKKASSSEVADAPIASATGNAAPDAASAAGNAAPDAASATGNAAPDAASAAGNAAPDAASATGKIASGAACAHASGAACAHAAGASDARAAHASGAARVNAAAESEVPELDVTKDVLVKSALIGLSAGVLSGYVGVGGGFIMVPLFLSKLNLPMKRASGTSLVAVGILVLPALATQVFLGNVSWFAGLACIVGSIPGATLGAKLQTRVPERALRFCFAGILGVAAVLLVIKELGFFG